MSFFNYVIESDVCTSNLISASRGHIKNQACCIRSPCKPIYMDRHCPIYLYLENIFFHTQMFFTNENESS